MSKKQLLNESEIRRFMKLANLEPLTKNVVKEDRGTFDRQDQTTTEAAMPHMMPKMQEAEPAMPDAAPDMGGDAMGGSDMSAEVEVGGADEEKLDMVSKFIEAGLKALGIEGSVEKEGDEGEEGGEEEDMGGEEEADEEDEGGEEEMDEASHKEEEMDEAWDGKKKDESQQLSEDELVETVLARVTARLVAEAKKKKMPAALKAKMMAKKKKAEDKGAAKPAAKPASKAKREEEKEKMDEALEGVNLAEKGKEKLNVYKGHADMEMGKGEKGGKGGHEMETVAAKAEHTVTHGGKNLATMGGNKKK